MTVGIVVVVNGLPMEMSSRAMASSALLPINPLNFNCTQQQREINRSIYHFFLFNRGVIYVNIDGNIKRQRCGPISPLHIGLRRILVQIDEQIILVVLHIVQLFIN